MRSPRHLWEQIMTADGTGQPGGVAPPGQQAHDAAARDTEALDGIGDGDEQAQETDRDWMPIDGW